MIIANQAVGVGGPNTYCNPINIRVPFILRVSRVP